MATSDLELTFENLYQRPGNDSAPFYCPSALCFPWLWSVSICVCLFLCLYVCVCFCVQVLVGVGFYVSVSVSVSMSMPYHSAPLYCLPTLCLWVFPQKRKQPQKSPILLQKSSIFQRPGNHSAPLYCPSTICFVWCVCVCVCVSVSASESFSIFTCVSILYHSFSTTLYHPLYIIHLHFAFHDCGECLCRSHLCRRCCRYCATLVLASRVTLLSSCCRYCATSRGSLDWFEADLSACPPSPFKVVCVLPILIVHCAFHDPGVCATQTHFMIWKPKRERERAKNWVSTRVTGSMIVSVSVLVNVSAISFLFFARCVGVYVHIYVYIYV